QAHHPLTIDSVLTGWVKPQLALLVLSLLTLTSVGSTRHTCPAPQRGRKSSSNDDHRTRPHFHREPYGIHLAAEEMLMKRLSTGIALAIVLLLPLVAGAQILVAGDGPVVYGHHHLNTTNMDAQKKFFVDTLGGTMVAFGSGDRRQQIIKFPNVLIFFRP